MKRITIVLYVLTALFSVSCSGVSGETEEFLPNISVNAGIGTGSKSVLEPDDLTDGTEIRLYDILSQNSYEKRIDGKTATYGATDWPIEDGPYNWVDKVGGTIQKYDHHFFAWLTKDKDGLTDAGMFGASPLTLANGASAGKYQVNVPQTEMTLTSTQFDFCYSEIVSRLSTDADYSFVDLNLKHFFSSFGLVFHNYTPTAATVKSVKIYGLTNVKSGSIAYDVEDGSCAVSYTAPATGSSTMPDAAAAVELLSSDVTLKTDEEADLTDGAILMWPQTASELSNAYVEVTYNIGGADVTTNPPICLRPVDSDNGWDAGTRHILELGLHSEKLTLNLSVAPWDPYEPAIDYPGELSVKETGMLKFKDGFCTVDEANKKVYFKGGNPITIMFTIDAPLNATWQISKKGDWDYFEIDNVELTPYNDPEHDSNYGTVDGTQAMVTIYPMTPDPDTVHEMQLSFSVRTNSGSVINADPFIQGPDPSDYYTFVLK